MLTYDFHDLKDETLTEYLYRRIRTDILEGRLSSGEKMPSKRAFARNVGVSTVTVENVYAQLMAEGYLTSKPRSGYFVEKIGDALLVPRGTGAEKAGMTDTEELRESGTLHESRQEIDLTGAETDPDTFPFGIWAGIIRGLLQDRRRELLTRAPGTGIYPLRRQIADYLLQYQDLAVSPEQIVIGAGTEYLYSLLIRLLGNDRSYAVETPGYPKTARIYETNGVNVRFIPMDHAGISLKDLEESGADIVHISPSHQFPTGITMPAGRRAGLLAWADRRKGYIIEDDYDSEFRLSGRPIPPLMSMDRAGRVIYLNTFTKSLACTVRISYMVLPERLLQRYREKLGFYSCTVSNFEQYTLAEFIRQGHFEKHINRMRTLYRKKQNQVLESIKRSGLPDMSDVEGAGAGLHFLLRVRTKRSGEELTERAKEAGVRIFCLDRYMERSAETAQPEYPCMVVNYSGLTDRQIRDFPALLRKAWI